MVHLLPHWTHPGKEGVTLPVVAYTNCHSVELFLDDKSLGEKVMPAELQIVWQVPYQPGVLRAIAKNEHGVPMAETTRKTAGAPAAIDLALTKSFFRPNRHDASIVEVTIVDKDGNMLPDAEDQVTFEIEGPGKLIGVDNGDVLDLNATKHVNTRAVFKGKCVGVVQATDRPGEIKITVRSGTLKTGTARITCAPA
jgi:beta-galactosidase